MRSVWELYTADLLQARSWFARERGSKLAVIAGFLIVMAATAAGTFSLSFLYLRNLASYGVFGTATAFYLVHAAIVVIWILAVGSSITVTLNFLITRNPSLEYLRALPLADSIIVGRAIGRAVSGTTILMALLLMPVMTAYGMAFHQGLSVSYIVRCLLLLLVVVLSSESVGGMISFALATYVRRNDRWAYAVVGTVILGGIFVLLRSIFPPALSALYNAPASDFLRLYHALPLSNTNLPTYWMAQILTEVSIRPVLAAVTATILLALISRRYRIRRYQSLYQDLQGMPYHQQNRLMIPGQTFSRRSPLAVKDVLSIIRTPSEIGYLGFLLVIAAFFFLMLIYAGSFRFVGRNWSAGLITFSLGWLLFFTIAFLLRMVFPLMARENRTSWYLFPLPIRPETIVASKLRSGMWLSAVFVVFAGLVWAVVPVGLGYKVYLMIWTTWAIAATAAIQVLMGMLMPNFVDGDDPERISTSLAGLVTLLISAVIVANVCYAVYMFLTTGWIPIAAWIGVAVTTVVPVIMVPLADRAVLGYEFR